jgi:hypothetical protein
MLGPISRVFTDAVHLRVSLLLAFNSCPRVQRPDYYGKLAEVACESQTRPVTSEYTMTRSTAVVQTPYSPE